MSHDSRHTQALSRLITFVMENRHMLSMLFDYVRISEVQSEELATTLVFLFEQRGRGRSLLDQAIVSGMNHYPNGRMLRETNFSVHVVSEYVRCWGKRYLRTILKEPLRSLLNAKTDVEIDPKRLDSSRHLEDNLAQLIEHVGLIVRNVIATRPPSHIDLTLRLLHEHLQKSETTASRSSFLIISSFLFLRFICPAIVSPELYGLFKKKNKGSITKEQQRKLILVAKVMQNIANEIVTAEKQNFLTPVGGFIEEEISRIREWSAQYLSDAKSTTTSQKDNTFDKKVKKLKIEPYMHRMGTFLMENEDKIRNYFEQEATNARSSKGGKEQEELINTCEIFLQHMDDMHMQIGFNPDAAESYEKVWERTQRRIRRLEKMQNQAQSSELKTSSASVPTWPGTSLFVSAEEGSTESSSSATTTFSTGEDDANEELDEVRDSLLSRTDINPEGKVIFKCFRDKTKKMVVLPLSTLNYPELRTTISSKFTDQKGSRIHKIKLAEDKNPSQDGYITDNSSLARFLRSNGTINENTIVYTLYVF